MHEPDLAQVGARCVTFGPGTSALPVSNDVWRESSDQTMPRSLGSWRERRALDWLRALRRGLSDALHWLYERALWQRCAISFGVGAVLGLSVVFTAAALGRGRGVPKASAVPRATLLATAVVPMVSSMPAAIPTRTTTPTPEVAALEQLPAELPVNRADSKHANKHAKARRSRRRAVASNDTWTFPRPQRRSN